MKFVAARCPLYSSVLLLNKMLPKPSQVAKVNKKIQGNHIFFKKSSLTDFLLRHSRVQFQSEENVKKGLGRKGANQSMALAGLEGDLLLIHGLRVELRKRIGGTTESGVKRAIHLVEPRRFRFPFPGHGFKPEESRSDSKNDRNGKTLSSPPSTKSRSGRVRYAHGRHLYCKL